MKIEIDPHPTLRVAAFTASYPTRLGEASSSDDLLRLLNLDADAPLRADDTVRGAVRDLLRWGGYKPTGRGKPASEYLLRVAREGELGSINPAVDACNAVSLHSGLPISVVDLGKASEPFRIGIAPEGTKYVFNAAGQEIDVGGLLCLFDSSGACANAVRDSQRTKTSADTASTLSIVWGTAGHDERLTEAVAWYRRLLEEGGALTSMVAS